MSAIDPGDEKRVQHLQLVQGVVDRLAGSSSSAKAWSVAIASALAALLAGEGAPFVALAELPVVVLWGLDAYYLRQERLFRALYDAVREGRADVPPFSMDTGPVAGEVDPWLRVAGSLPLAAFHLGLLAMVALACLLVAVA